MSDDYDAPMPERAVPKKRYTSFNSTQWINDDCSVKVCRSGYISVTDYDGYSVAHRCPKCNRWDAPSVRAYSGLLELFTGEEMEARRAERQEIVMDAQKRKEAGKTLISGVAGVV